MTHSNSHLSICPLIDLSVCPSICTWFCVLPQWYLCQTGCCVWALNPSLPTGVLMNSSNYRIFFLHLSALPLIGVSVLRIRGLQMCSKCLCLQGAEDLNCGVLMHAQQEFCPWIYLPSLPAGILSSHSRILLSNPLILFLSPIGNKALCRDACFPQPCFPKAQQMNFLGWKANCICFPSHSLHRSSH